MDMPSKNVNELFSIFMEFFLMDYFFQEIKCLKKVV